MAKPKAMFILGLGSASQVYGPDEQAAVAGLADVLGPPISAAGARYRTDLLGEVEVIFSGWGAPKLNAEFLGLCPRLRAFFYGAGSIRSFVFPEFWERGIAITSARAANAESVAEYCLAQILFSLKRGWSLAHAVRGRRGFVYGPEAASPGNHGSVVGLVSLGAVAERLLEHLRRFEHHLLAYDPFCSEVRAAQLGVRLVSLEELFARSDCVSLHTPWLKETERLIRGHHFRALPRDATFINTARGAVVHEDEMVEALRDRPDVQAVLDVTFPEPPEPNSLLYSLPNVLLTPHIAGATGMECRRMGRMMVQEFRRWLRGEPLAWAITPEASLTLA